MSTAPAHGWSRRQLLAMVATVTLAALTITIGLGYAVLAAATSTSPRTGAEAGSALGVAEQLPAGTSRRDAIAAAPMLVVSRADSRSGQPATGVAGTIDVPSATTLGAADVPTGFPHTAEGAVAQLAAITSTVLQGMSMDVARTVHQQWTAPGGVAFAEWELTANVQAFLASAAGAYTDEAWATVAATPVAAQVKGADGPDWVLACVLLDVQVSIVTNARAAYGHCERMQWDTKRWVIGPGAAPAEAPSTWPGTDLAITAGWRTWVTSGQE